MTILSRSAPARAAPRSVLHEIWRYREMLRSLVLRNLRVKYKKSVFGFVWTLLNPLMTAGVLIGVFSVIVRLPIPHYWAFLLSGYFVWHFLQQMLAAAVGMISEHAALRRSAAFPNEILILGATFSRLIEFTVELSLALVLLTLFHHQHLPLSYVFLPLLVLLQVVMAIGLAMPIAALAVFYHDIQHALPALLLTLFYASPVFYPASLVPAQLQVIYHLNPIAGLLTLYHQVVYEATMPSPSMLALVAGFAGAVFAAGYAIFNHYKGVFAEVV